MEYPVKIVKFSSVYNLSLHIPKSIGGDNTKIFWIGLRGWLCFKSDFWIYPHDQMDLIIITMCALFSFKLLSFLYIGEFTEMQRDKIVLASYELAANPADMHVKSDKKMNYEIF